MEVEMFGTIEEAMEHLEEARKAANAKVKPWQAKARPGACFISVSPEGLVIFGQVLEMCEEPQLQHYRFCRCYSVACPDGELGDVHVSTISRFISREAFEQARQDGWRL